jgi:UDP-N-acetylmuramoyl-L-alanyl-D-glutamate--2,6-diaminopimelate ligase
MVRKSSAKIIRYGLKADFELYASHLQLSSHGMAFDVRWKQETVTLKTVLIGRFNVYNILAATALALMQGMTLQQIAKKLESFSGVPGRLERVVNQKNLQVFVDYSHKPDALKNVLQTLAELKKGRLITVFGCGGNRDMQKRPQMAAISESFSDLTIVTNDNPRNEDPTEIARQIIGGFQKNSYLVELDRKKAILQALELAKPDDIILIAGKGHETYQIFAHQTLVFDDRQVVQEACSG